MFWEPGSVELAFEVGVFGTVIFIVELSFLRGPSVVVPTSCFGVVSELIVVTKDVWDTSLLVVPSGGVPSAGLLGFVTDTMPGIVTEAFVVEVSAGVGIESF